MTDTQVPYAALPFASSKALAFFTILCLSSSFVSSPLKVCYMHPSGIIEGTTC